MGTISTDSPSAPSFLSNVFVGLAVIGDVINKDVKKAGAAIAMILTDHYKTELVAAGYWQVYGKSPVEGEDFMADTMAIAAYERLKNFVRSIVQGMIDEEEHRYQVAQRDRQKLQLEALQLRLRMSNMPHPEGTVAELAERFGVSKSEIRRRKTDGTLNELLAKESK